MLTLFLFCGRIDYIGFLENISIMVLDPFYQQMLDEARCARRAEHQERLLDMAMQFEQDQDELYMQQQEELLLYRQQIRSYQAGIRHDVAMIDAQLEELAQDLTPEEQEQFWRLRSDVNQAHLDGYMSVFGGVDGNSSKEGNKRQDKEPGFFDKLRRKRSKNQLE